MIINDSNRSDSSTISNNDSNNDTNNKLTNQCKEEEEKLRVKRSIVGLPRKNTIKQDYAMHWKKPWHCFVKL